MRKARFYSLLDGQQDQSDLKLKNGNCGICKTLTVLIFRRLTFFYSAENSGYCAIPGSVLEVSEINPEKSQFGLVVKVPA